MKNPFRHVSPRMRASRNGKVTLSGIPAPMVRDILIAAWLHHDEHPYERRPLEDCLRDVAGMDEIHEANERSNENWHRSLRWVLDALLYPKPDDPWDGLPLKEALRMKDKERKELDALIVEIMKGEES